jgi:hypothetical protein
MTPQLKFRLPEEEAEIERIMLHEVCNRGEAIRRLEKRAAEKNPAPEPKRAHWNMDQED